MSRASRVAVAPRALPPLRPLDADDDDEQLGDTAATAAAAGRGPARAVTLADDDADVDEELSLRRASRSSPASPSSPSPSSSSSCLSRQVSMMTLLLTCALVLAFVLAVAIGWSHDGELSPTGWRIASSSNSDSTGARNMQHTTNSRPKHTTNPTAARATPSAAAANQQSSSLSYECPVLSPLPPVSDHSPEWPDVLRQSQVRGPPSASASVRYSVNALLNWTCPKTVIRTHAWLDRPDDPTGRRTVCPRQGGNMPRHCEDLDDTSKLVLPYEGYGDAVPYWLRVQGPMVVPAYGALTSMDGQSAWVLQGGCAHQPKDTGPGNGWWPRLEMAPQDVPRANHRIKKAIVLSQLMCDGFYHFFAETMTKITLLPPELLYDPSYSILLLPPREALALEVLAAFNLSSRIIAQSKDTWQIVEDELIIMKPASCDLQNPIMLNRYQRLMWAAALSYQKDQRLRDKFGSCFDPRVMNHRPESNEQQKKRGVDQLGRMRPLDADAPAAAAAAAAAPAPAPAPAPASSSPSPPAASVRPLPLGLLPALTDSSGHITFRRILFMKRRGVRRLADPDGAQRIIERVFPGVPVDTYDEGTLIDTALLISGADLIITPHGAGEACLMFALPGTIIVEMIQQTHLNLMYPHHMAAWGMARHYFYLIQTQTNEVAQLDMASFERAMQQVRAQSPVERRLDIEEAIRRRMRGDSSCVSELQLEAEGRLTEDDRSLFAKPVPVTVLNPTAADDETEPSTTEADSPDLRAALRSAQEALQWADELAQAKEAALQAALSQRDAEHSEVLQLREQIRKATPNTTP